MDQQTPKRRGKRILLVENAAGRQRQSADYLARAGYRCDIVGEGEQAVIALFNRHCDLLVLDCEAPKADVRETIKQIRRLEAQRQGGGPADRPRLPVVALVSGEMIGNADECLMMGADAYLAKPIHPTKLVASIDAILSASEGSSDEEDPGEPPGQRMEPKAA
jgi:two-component system, sensor histidine kinase and response regulator